MNYLGLFLLAVALGVPQKIDHETARHERRLEAMKVVEKVTIDGRLDEPEWLLAPVAGNFIQNEPEEDAPATQQTEIRVMYDQDNLYFAINAKQAGDQIIISELKKDFNVNNGDSVQIALDTFHDERNAYLFSINPAGAKWDAQMSNEGRETNQSWDGVWYVRSRITEDGWIAEVAIPFKTLKFPNAPVQTWGINFQRTLRHRNEDSLWSPVPRIYSVQRVSLAGTLEGLEGIEPGSNIKIKPYFFWSFAQNPQAVKKYNYDRDGGLDIKYGLTSGLTWDFTYNTDFSQVEADEQQINLTRFSLFFPEKRDFFLENSGIFQFGSNTAGGGGGGGGGANPRPNASRNDMVLFFSRNIGISEDGEAIPILGGTRLTGRAGRYELGILNIQQRKYGETGATNFFVGRVRRNILANSDIGVMVTNKEVANSNLYNRSVGADANFRFGQALSVNGFLVKTLNPGNSDKTMASRIGMQYQDNVWRGNASYTTIQDNFNNEMGFTPRVGIGKFAGRIGRTWRPERWRRIIRSIEPHLQLDYVESSSGRLETKYVDYHLPFNFQDGSFVEIGINPTLEYPSLPFRISGYTIDPRQYKFNEYFFLGNTDSSKRVSANVRWATGRFYSGYKHTYVGGGTFRANHKLTTSFTYTHNNITLDQGRRVKQNLLSTRFNYGFSTTAFLNALIQYNSDTRQWSSNIRFNVIHRPLSDLFIVYNERRDSLSGSLVDRALIAKMTYMISR
jgi:hypothetical protein